MVFKVGVPTGNVLGIIVGRPVERCVGEAVGDSVGLLLGASVGESVNIKRVRLKSVLFNVVFVWFQPKSWSKGAVGADEIISSLVRKSSSMLVRIVGKSAHPESGKLVSPDKLVSLEAFPRDSLLFSVVTMTTGTATRTQMRSKARATTSVRLVDGRALLSTWLILLRRQH